LEYLHAHHPPIVFRDLKPANIMRTPTGQLFLIDFGIARYFKPGQAKDTVALGSLGYAAPEQYGKAQTTPRADIYSLGAVLHQLLTTSDPSEAPFRFLPLRPKSPQGHPDPGSLSTSMVDVLVNKLEGLVSSMLEMDVNKRPKDVDSVKQELHVMKTLWSDINKSFWRPRLGYPQQVRK
jgi:serine/threonine protein kinase